MKRFLSAIIILITLIILSPQSATGASKDKEELEWNRRKASYIFLEAMRQREKDNLDAFFELLRQAHRLDPENSIVSYYLGICYISMNNSSREIAEEGYRLMKKHFAEKPDDYDEAVTIANVASRLGHNDEAIAVLDTLTSRYPEKLEVRAMLADAYARNRQFREAIATYDSLEAVDGKSIAISLRKINYYLALDDTTGTINEGMDLYHSAPDNATYNLLMGNIYMQMGRQDSAMLYIDRAQVLDPENGMTYLTKAQIYYNDGDSVNYDKQIYQALISKDLDVENKVAVLTDYIKQLLAERDSSQRIDNLFKVLISQHPHESDIHDLYSEYFFTRGDYNKAAEQLEYVTDIDPSDSRNWKRLMMVYLIAENFPKTIETARKALEYNPANLDLYQYVAPAYYQIKEYDKALLTYRKALEIADSSDYALRSSLTCGIADVYGALNDTAKTIECYKEAIKLDPGNFVAMNNYAYYLAVRDIDLDEAERLSALAVKDEPANETYLDTYAVVFFRKKEYKLALAYIEKAIKNCREENAEILEHYGDILFMNGQFDKAAENWEKALELNPESDILKRKVKYKTYFNE